MKTKNIVMIFIIIVLGAGLYFTQTHQNGVGKQEHHEIWYCPMHPHYTSDHPGQCPICGMDLVKRTKVSEKQTDAVKDYTAITESVQKQFLAGVKTEKVTKKTAVKTIRLSGQYQGGEVYAQAFELDLPYIKVGQTAIVNVPAYHQQYEGAIRSIDSNVDEVSRTILVRVWLKQPNRKKLKSNMYVSVFLPIELKGLLIVPQEAVMDTGMRKIIFIQHKEGMFEPREIQTGVETDNGVEVTQGLKEGERVVVSGNFLLDSESRLQAGLKEEEDHD